VTTETGAGQWGTALSMACSYFDLDCKVFMVKVSYEQKPFRREAAADVKALCGVSHRCAKEVAPLTRSYKGILSRQHTTIPPFNSYP